MPGTGKDYARISFLFGKFINGTCSIDETREIIGILEDSGNDVSLIGEAGARWNTLNTDHKDNLSPTENRFIMKQILDRLHHRIRLNE